MNNFIKYIGIFLGICAGAVLIVLGAMVLLKFQLFGYQYVSISTKDSDTVIISKSEEGFENCPATMADKIMLIDKISINTDNIGVKIRPWINGYIDNKTQKVQVGNYTVIPEIKATGFAKVEERGTLLSVDVKLVPYLLDENNEESVRYEIQITAKCPSGLIHYSASTIFVYTPFLSETIFNDTTYTKSYSTSTTFNAFDHPTTGMTYPYDTDILTVNRVDTLHLKEVNIQTSTGDVDITDNVDGVNNEAYAGATIFIDKLNVTTESGDITLHRCGVKDLNVATDSGDMSFSSLTNGTIAGNVTLKDNRGKIVFDDGINLGYGSQNYSSKSAIKLSGELCQITLSSIINANVEYEGNADFIKIGSILHSSVNIQSSNAHIQIGSIYSNSNINLSYNEENGDDNKSGYRTIDVDYIECSDYLTLSTWTGAINIGTLINHNNAKNTTIVTESGNVNINKLIGNTNVRTKSGNITIAQRNAYTDEEKNDLATEIVTKRYEVALKAKENLYDEYERVIDDAYKSDDKLYAEFLENEQKTVKDQIDTIKQKRDDEKVTLGNIHNTYNTEMRTQTHIEANTVSGTVRLKNLITDHVNVMIRDNGNANIYAQFKEVGLTSNADIKFFSGKGNTNLYMPNALYWVYAMDCKVVSSNIFFTNNELNSGYCEASIATSNEYTQQPYKVKLSAEDDGDYSIEQIKALNVSQSFVTISSAGGENNFKTTDEYKD